MNNKNHTPEDVEYQNLLDINYDLSLSEEMDTIWKFHPSNPNKLDITEYYANLLKQSDEIGVKIN
jgi:hypothetical protein